MTTLKKHLLEQVVDLPRLFLRRKLKSKLKDQEIKDKALLNALKEHILTNSGEEFIWDDDDEGQKTKDLSIVFTEEDGSEILESLNRFLKDDLPDVVKTPLKTAPSP